MGSDSRYDRARPVGPAEFQQSRALHIVGELVRDYSGITNGAVAGQVAHVLHAAANELGNGRALPVEVRRAVLALAEELRRDMAPPPDDLGATP